MLYVALSGVGRAKAGQLVAHNPMCGGGQALQRPGRPKNKRARSDGQRSPTGTVGLCDPAELLPIVEHSECAWPAGEGFGPTEARQLYPERGPVLPVTMDSLDAIVGAACEGHCA